MLKNKTISRLNR